MFDLQGLNIYLIGMMGSGKTTTGELLATQLGYRFIDTDTTIEKLANQTVSEIFQTSGESEFRRLETQVLAEISAYTRLVVATGGGIAIDLENWNHLQQGLVVWLDPSTETIVERLQGDDTRPLLDSVEDLHTRLQQLGAARRDRYAAADIHIPIVSNLPPIDVVDRIITLIPTVLKKTVS